MSNYDVLKKKLIAKIGGPVCEINWTLLSEWLEKTSKLLVPDLFWDYMVDINSQDHNHEFSLVARSL